MPEHDIPTLDEILNEPVVEKRINSLIAIAYTNYNSINTINDKIEEICSENSRGMNKKEKGVVAGGIATGIVMGIGALLKTLFGN